MTNDDICRDCDPPGSGKVEVCNPLDSADWYLEDCVECEGTGKIPWDAPTASASAATAGEKNLERE